MSEWLLQRGKGKTIGPFTTGEIVDGIRSGQIPRDTFVCDVAGKSWTPLDAEPAFAEARGAPRAESTTAAKPAETSGTIAIESVAAARPSARRPFRVAFGAASAAGRARALAASGVLVFAGVVDVVLPRTPAGRDLCDAVRALRDVSVLAAAIAFVSALGVAVGVARDRRGEPSGSTLARGASLGALVGLGLAGALAMAFARDGGVLAAVARRAATFASIAELVAALVAIGLAWPVFRVPTRGRALAIARAFTATALAALALFAIGARAERAFDVLYVQDPLDAPAFRDAQALGRWLDAEHDGAARPSAIVPLLATAELLPCDARVRFVREIPRGPGEPAREVELLDGPSRGTHLFVPRRATSPTRHACP